MPCVRAEVSRDPSGSSARNSRMAVFCACQMSNLDGTPDGILRDSSMSVLTAPDRPFARAEQGESAFAQTGVASAGAHCSPYAFYAPGDPACSCPAHSKCIRSRHNPRPASAERPKDDAGNSLRRQRPSFVRHQPVVVGAESREDIIEMIVPRLCGGSADCALANEADQLDQIAKRITPCEGIITIRRRGHDARDRMTFGESSRDRFRSPEDQPREPDGQ